MTPIYIKLTEINSPINHLYEKKVKKIKCSSFISQFQICVNILALL